MTFSEGFVEADGFRIRYMEAGQGTPVVHLHGAGGMRLTQAHALLSRQYRVVVFEMPGFGASSVNDRTQSVRELGATMAHAVRAMGIERYNVIATSFGARVALWMALQQSERILALVLEAPAAIRPSGHQPPSGTPEQIARQLYAHPERVPMAPVDPDVQRRYAVAAESHSSRFHGGPGNPAGRRFNGRARGGISGARERESDF